MNNPRGMAQVYHPHKTEDEPRKTGDEAASVVLQENDFRKKSLEKSGRSGALHGSKK
jgi:hypothetical protein